MHSSIAVDLTLTNFLPLFAGKTMVLVEEKPGVEGLVKLLRQKPEMEFAEADADAPDAVEPAVDGGREESQHAGAGDRGGQSGGGADAGVAESRRRE